MIPHLIITRLAIKWLYKSSGLTWKDWIKNSIQLMDEYCRASLRNQTNQNFILLSLVDNSVSEYGNIIKGKERILRIDSESEYPRQKIINAINEFIIYHLIPCEYIITTRLDRDDCLRNDFINNVKKYFTDDKEKYIDLKTAYTYDSEKNVVYETDMYKTGFCSPFVSTKEKVINGKIKCISMAYDHVSVSEKLTGKKVDDLFALQVIHNTNISNKINGKKTEIDLRRYGL